MRLNRFVALATGKSRRGADDLIAEHRIKVNDVIAQLGARLEPDDTVTLDGKSLVLPATTTIMLHKPAGYVCSRDGQGSKTIYDLLPAELHNLNPVGRLDKDSTGLLLLTNDGELSQRLTHPSSQKEKVYQVELDKPLLSRDKAHMGKGVELNDGPSRLGLRGRDKIWTITMTEGRNRQIRRTFEALGYKVIKLHRTNFGPYKLGRLKVGIYQAYSSNSSQ